MPIWVGGGTYNFSWVGFSEFLRICLRGSASDLSFSLNLTKGILGAGLSQDCALSVTDPSQKAISEPFVGQVQVPIFCSEDSSASDDCGGQPCCQTADASSFFLAEAGMPWSPYVLHADTHGLAPQSPQPPSSRSSTFRDTIAQISAVKLRGRERKGPPEIIQKFRLRKWPISSADFPMTPLERTGPFWEKDFGAISGSSFFSRPLCFTAEDKGQELNTILDGGNSAFVIGF